MVLKKVGTMTKNRFTLKGLPVLKPCQHIKVKTNHDNRLIRIFLTVLIATFSITTVPARAIETTKANALKLQEIRNGSSYSFQKSPPLAKADPCLPLIHARRLSPGASAGSQTSRIHAGKAAVPVALGLFLGARIALGPKEVVKPSNRVQIGPEFRMARIDSNEHALAIAAYRSCKNDHTLSLHNNKKGVQN
jgi:hypothetical protein